MFIIGIDRFFFFSKFYLLLLKFSKQNKTNYWLSKIKKKVGNFNQREREEETIKNISIIFF